MNRYLRQMMLPELGFEGQERLQQARVLCVGAGGLGSPASLYLAAAGIGQLGLIDPDRVDETNLQRQILFGTSDVGVLKVEAARDRLVDLNPEVEIKIHPEALSETNATDILRQYDVIIDGTDNFPAKFLINDTAVKLGLPVVYGSVSQFEGRAAIFWAEKGPCYRCMHPNPPQARIHSCAEAGVIGSLAGIIGSIQAMEAIKLVAKLGTPLVGRLLVIDSLSMSSQSFSIPKNSNCPACG